jgi:hypothetical protein
VSLCVDAYEKLRSEGVKARVVSIPCWELFERQDQAYRDSVIPPDVTARISVEQASTFGWSRYVGPTGESIGMHTFGASAPLKALQKKFGFTPEQVAGPPRRDGMEPFACTDSSTGSTGLCSSGSTPAHSRRRPWREYAISEPPRDRPAEGLVAS